MSLNTAAVMRPAMNPSRAHKSSGGRCRLPTRTISGARWRASSRPSARATRLARLWQLQGEATEAHDHFAPVYGWFTEWFGTADLKREKALSDELS